LRSINSAFPQKITANSGSRVNGLLATAELLSDTGLDARQKKYVNIMHSAGLMLLAIINDILDLSKLEAGKIVLEPAVIDVLQEADVTASIFYAQATAKKIEFTQVVDSSVPPYFVADLNRLRQIVSNLINNAIKYTQQGRVDKKLSVVEDGDRRYLRFTVSDTGPGVPLESQKKIFQKFSRLNNGGKIPGTGLGLSICKALVDLMGGRIGVISDGVNGSVFWFELPLVLPSEGNKSATGQDLPATKDTHVGCKVLLVEDVEMNRVIAAEMLGKLGCVVDSVEDGKAAIEASAQKSYDLIFMDCQMPVMNGFDATRAIRDRGDKMPILALTANAFAEEVDKCMAVGMNDTVFKPIQLSILARVLDKWHDACNAPNPIASAPPPETAAEAKRGFDPSCLRELIAAFPDKAGQLIALTLRDSARFYGEIEQAVIDGNAVEINESAHALKSVAKQVGGLDFASLCSKYQPPYEAIRERGTHTLSAAKRGRGKSERIRKICGSWVRWSRRPYRRIGLPHPPHPNCLSFLLKFRISPLPPQARAERVLAGNP
jgi:CheY-like chemotaxis protein